MKKIAIVTGASGGMGQVFVRENERLPFAIDKGELIKCDI